MRKYNIPVIFLLSLAFLTVRVAAQSTDSSGSYSSSSATYLDYSTSSSLETVKVNTVVDKGRLLRVEDNKITVETEKNGTLEIQPNSSIRVTRSGSVVKLSELQVNDQVSVTRTDSGEVLSIDATPGTLADISRLIVPALIVIAILIVLIAWFLSRRNKGHIKTGTTSKS
jgi:hypothetical protein